MAQILISQKPGLVTRILLGIATLALVIAGFFFLTIALVAGALLALVIGARLWWTLRKIKRDMAQGASATSTHAGTQGTGKEALDGEYQVVDRETGATKLPPQT